MNLASQEYFKAGRPQGASRRVSLNACSRTGRAATTDHQLLRQARGLMARYAITHRHYHPPARGFDLDGYAYDQLAIQPERLVFRRKPD